MEYLLENSISILGVITFILAIVSIFLFFKLQKKAKPSYEVSSLTVLANQGNLVPSEVTVRFGKSPINCLVRERIIFWNDGNDTLYGTDIAKKDPLRISFGAKDVTVLMSDVIKCTREVNSFVVVKQKRSSELLLQYDYLDKKDGAVIEVWHNAEQSEVEVTGSIKRIPEGVKQIIGIIPEGKKRPQIFYILVPFIIRELGVASIIAGLAVPIVVAVTLFRSGNFGVFSSSADTGVKEVVLVGVAYLFLMVLGVLILWRTRRRYPKSLIVE